MKKLSSTTRRFLEAMWIGGSFAAVASAQTAMGPSAPSEQLEEVVVTAQKRESTVQATPISMTALSGQSLADAGITDIASIVQSVPGVSMRTSGPGQTELEMRGMTSSGGNSSTVGLYLDDIPMTAPAAAQNGKVVIDPNLYDLSRVEVLRGPQGTLYGAGSMGGTVKLVPTAPNPAGFDTSEEVILGHTNYGDSLNHSENAMVNFPLWDAAAIRIVASQETLSGWIDRKVVAYPFFPLPVDSTTRGDVATAPLAANHRDVNDEKMQSVRASVLWNATDRFTIQPFFMYQKISQDGLSLIDSNPGNRASYQPYDTQEPFSDRIYIGSLNLKYHFNFADLSSTTSWWSRKELWSQDSAESIATVVQTPIYPEQGGVGQTNPASLETDMSRQVSEEMRLTSSDQGSLKWIVGLFYQRFVSSWDLAILTPFTAIPGTIPNAYTQHEPTRIQQNSVFGEVSYTFLDAWTATLGARRFYYSDTVHGDVSGWLSPTGDNTVTSFSTGEKDQGVTPKVSISYHPNKDALFYATFAEGFRPGGGNILVPTSGALGASCLENLQAIGLDSAPLGFKSDKVLSYELGQKYRDRDGRVTVNSAGYFESWEHIQQNIPLACGYPFTGNAGKAHIYGAEIELNALLAPGLIFSANGSFSHARYTQNAVPSATIDERVQAVPDVTFSTSLTYRRPISDSLHVLARIDNNYIGSRIDTTAQANYLSPYDLTNIRGGVEGQSWSATIFVNNVTDKLARLSNSPEVAINMTTYNRTSIQQPLTIGLDMSYRFGSAH